MLNDWRGSSSEKHGLALRAISDLFDASASIPNAVVTCSYVEIYNDTCNDLLGKRKGLPLREGPDKAPYIEGLAQEAVGGLDAAMAALARGTSSRTVAAMYIQRWLKR